MTVGLQLTYQARILDDLAKPYIKFSMFMCTNNANIFYSNFFLSAKD